MEEVVTNVDENLEVDTQGGFTSNTEATANASAVIKAGLSLKNIKLSLPNMCDTICSV